LIFKEDLLIIPYTYAAMLVALMANPAYMPLDDGFPTERVQFITTDTELKAIVSTAQVDQKLDKIEVPKIYVDADEAIIRASSSERPPTKKRGPATDELASTIYHKSNLQRVTLSIDGSEHRPGRLTKKKRTEIMLSNARGATAMTEPTRKQISKINELEIYRKGGGNDDGPSLPPCTTDVRKELSRLGVPGLSAVIVKNGRVACTAVAGMANIEKNRPVEPETLFAWASVSKTVTAAAVMKLVDDGTIKLDDDINAYLPFPVRIPACPEKPITFLHLLTHTSSIVESEHKGVYAHLYVKGDSPIALGDFLKDYLVPSGAYYNSKKNFKKRCPGTDVSYSNVAVGLLGYLVEVIAGTPFEVFSRDHIFTPLGMKEAAWRLSELDPEHVAMPYSGDQSSGFKPAGHIGFPTFPDGLLRTSAPQLARFLLMFMQFGELDGTRILSRESAASMRHVYFPELNDKQGLIWHYTSFGSRKRVIGHDGSDPGTSSMMYFDPKDGAGVLLVANGSWKWKPAMALVEKLFKEANVIDDESS
jgi:CubicO group peptidase (beta-lactamase class C family)